MKTILKIIIVLIVNFHLLTSNLHAQSPVDSVGSGCSLRFTATNGHLKMGGYNFGTSNFSLEVWIKADISSIGSTRVIITNGYQGLPLYAVAINTLGEPYMFLRDVSGNQVYIPASGFQVNDNKWHHLVAVRNGSDGTFYLDGVLVASATNSAMTNISTTCTFTWIGATNTTSFGCPSAENEARFLGEMDEMRFWNYALTQTEIQQNMCQKLTGTETGLIGYWKFDDCGGLTLTDNSGSGNNATLQ